MMKLALYFILIYQFAQLTQGFMPLQAINKLMFTPPGCLACYKAEAKNYFQNLQKFSPNCAEEEISRFNAISAKYFLAHICVYQIGTGFQSKYDSLQNYGNQILRKFRKCLNNRLSTAGKNYLKNFTEIFESARMTCENGNFLEKGLEGIRQIYLEPSAEKSHRGHKRNRKQLQNVPKEEFEPVSKKLTPVKKREKTASVETLPNTLSSQHPENLQENSEIQHNKTDETKVEDDTGIVEEIPELSSNTVEKQDKADDFDPTLMESSVEASDQPSSIEDIDNSKENSEIQSSKENDDGTSEETSELSSNAIEHQKNVDDTLEDSASTLEDQPPLTEISNLREKVQDHENLAAQADPTLFSDDSSSNDLYDQTSEDQSTPIVTNAPEEVEENIPLTNNPISEDLTKVQDDALLAQDTSNLSIDEKSPENLYDVTSTSPIDDVVESLNKNALVPLEETLIAAPVRANESNLPELSTDDEPTPLTNDSTIENSPETSEPEDILKSSPKIDDKPMEQSFETSEDQIESQANDNKPQNLPQSQNDDDKTPLDSEESTQSNDFSEGNLSEESSEDQPTPTNTTDTQTLEESGETINDQSDSTSDVATDDSSLVQENDTPEEILKSPDDDISSVETPEEIQSTAPLETKDPMVDFSMPQEDNLQTGGDNSAPIKIDTSLDNSLETKSENEIIPQINDSSIENLNQTEQEDAIEADIPAETQLDNLDQIPESSTDIPSDNSSAEALPETEFKDANDFIPDTTTDNFSEIRENIVTPEIIPTSELNDSTTENATKFENFDEILPTDPASLEPMNLVERISTSADVTKPSSQNGITENTHKELVNDESSNPTLTQDNTPSKSPTKDELYEKFHDALTHFATDTVLEDNESIDETTSKDNSKNMENNSGDEINNEDLINSGNDSSSSNSNKQDQNFESTSTSSEDDSAKIEASDPSHSTNHLLDADVAKAASSLPSLENQPEIEPSDQSSDTTSPTSDLISSEESPKHEDMSKVELSEASESESALKGKLDDSTSILEDEQSHEKPEQPGSISEPEMNDKPDHSPTTLSLENDSTAQTSDASSEHNPINSTSAPENQTSIPANNELQENQTESTEINLKTVKSDQASSLENPISQDDVSLEKQKKTTEADSATVETNIANDLPQNELNEKSIPSEGEIDDVEGKQKEIEDDKSMLDYFYL